MTPCRAIAFAMAATVVFAAGPLAAQEPPGGAGRPMGCASGWRICPDSLSESFRARFVWQGYERAFASYQLRASGSLFSRRHEGRQQWVEVDAGVEVPIDQETDAQRKLVASTAVRYRVRPADWDNNEWWSAELSAIGGHMPNGRVTGFLSAARAERFWNPAVRRGWSEYPPVLTLSAGQFFGGLDGSLVGAQLSMTVPQLLELAGWNGLFFVGGTASNLPAPGSSGTPAFRGDVAELGLRVMHETTDLTDGTVSVFIEGRCVWSARIAASAVPVIAFGFTFRR